MLRLGALPRIGDTWVRTAGTPFDLDECWIIVDVDPERRVITWDLYLNGEKEGQFTEPWHVFCAENAKLTNPLRYVPRDEAP